ncbi:hypothetical protein [Candidatus Odyssella thessalonicensis]|uniref:hypothetical protein n=1 Tax=Candidatus Odyssella thessalonicensis TaxID=84647 RepID=UPI000225B493|nr:hypothetical protein [Candidatus Odyssella thessalonicensis]
MVNQSNANGLDRLKEEGYLSKTHPHTIIYNIDQEVALLSPTSLYIGKLTLTNASNNCTTIRANFLSGCTSLTYVDTQGLPTKVLNLLASVMEQSCQIHLRNSQLSKTDFSSLD